MQILLPIQYANLLLSRQDEEFYHSTSQPTCESSSASWIVLYQHNKISVKYLGQLTQKGAGSEIVTHMHCTNKSGVKYFIGQLIQFIIYVVWGFANQMS